MDRRHALAAIAALAAGPALAQSSQMNQSSGSAGQGSMNASGSAMSGDMQQMGKAEMEHAMRTQQLGMMSLEMSRMAEKKAKDDDVKQFAKLEVAEQETVADVLKTMKDPSATSSTSAGQSDDKTDTKAQAAMQKLQKADGAEFDKEYVQAQMDGHKELLEVQQTYLKNGKNLSHMVLAKLASATIKEHMTHLQELEKDMGKKKG